MEGKYKKDPVRISKRNEMLRALAKKNRNHAIQKYGGKCACCGEEHIEFLAFDHIEGSGNKHRKLFKITGQAMFLRWLKRNNYPKIIRILCHNCNCARGFYGYCPHELEQRNI